jgi:hypothetical protein
MMGMNLIKSNEGICNQKHPNSKLLRAEALFAGSSESLASNATLVKQGIACCNLALEMRKWGRKVGKDAYS